MKMIKITEKNFMSVAGRVKKFFDHRDIVTWHNFNCGGKRHIQGDFKLNCRDYFKMCRSKKVKPIFRYHDVHAEIVPDGSIYRKEPFIRVNLDPDNGLLIQIGQSVAFCGNRIIVISDCGSYRNPGDKLYEVYQLWDNNGGFRYLSPNPPSYFMDWDFD